VSCHAGSSGYYYATVWECVRQQDDHDLPVNIGIGIRTDRARAIREAVEDAVERVRYGEREHAGQLIESWVCGNLRDPLILLCARSCWFDDYLCTVGMSLRMRTK
jgi:hypothetical protein